MNVSLYQAAAALNANSRWQEVISENLASSGVPGFKKQELSLAAVRAGLMPASAGNGPQAFALPKATTSTSFLPGTLQYTGNTKDVAVEGNGFFQVQLSNGQKAFTRDGEFQMSAQGQLVTKEGYTVIGDGGPIQLDIHNTEPLSISANGEVSQGSVLRGKLKLVDFDKPAQLNQISAGYFTADKGNIMEKPATGTLRQGYLEGSNFSVVGEMANMMTAMRGFEANTRIIQMQDDRLGKTISELGNPS